MRNVDVFIASLPRQLHVVDTVKTVLSNPETRSITITANKYSDELFDELKLKLLNANTLEQIPIFLHRGDNAKESNEKLKYIGEGTGRYISFMDDDLLIAPTHFKLLIEGCEKYNAYVSLHGCILTKLPIQSYYRDRIVYRGLGSVSEDLPVDIASNCGSLFKRSWFSNEYLSEIYRYAPTVSMDDIIMATVCRLNNVMRFVLKHPEGFMKHKVQYKEDEYVFDKYALTGNDSVQTSYINKYWNIYKK